MKKDRPSTLSVALPASEREFILEAARASRAVGVSQFVREAAQQDAAREHKKKRDEIESANQRLTAIQRKRRLDLDLLWQKMKVRQWHEWKVLLAHIDAEKKRHIARRHWLAVGLALYLRKIAVIRQLIEYYETRRKRRTEDQYRLLLEGLRRRHDNEAAELRRRYAALERLERREAFTFAQKFGALDDTDTDEIAPTLDDVVVTYHAEYDAGPAWDDFQRNAMDIVMTPPSMSAAYSENLADITGPLSDSIPRSDFDSLYGSADAVLTGYGATWSLFAENARDITSPDVTVRFAADDEDDTVAAATGTGGRGPAFTTSAWPGAG